jgi:hypothetical protein
MNPDNNNTKQELLIELRTLVKLIEADNKQPTELKLALSAILQILQIQK